MAAFEALFGPNLRAKDGVVETKATLEGQAAVGIYFATAAHKETTATLSQAWTEALSAKGLHIVFVPCDGTEEEVESTWAETPWFTLPVENKAEKDALCVKYNAEGGPTPRLVLLDAEGNVLTVNGVEKVLEDPVGDGFPWEEEQPPPVLSEHELFVRMGSVPPDPGESGLKGVFLNSKNYIPLGLVDQEEESDDIPFSGFKLKPYIFVSKDGALDEVKKMGFASDWDQYKKDIAAFPGKELLLIFDPERTYGDSIVMCVKQESYDREWARIEEKRDEVKAAFDKEHAKKEKGGGGGGGAEGEEGDEDGDVAEENIVVRDLPRDCKEWVSETAAATHEEVANFTVHNSRPLMQVMITRARMMFGKACKFSDSGENLHSCRPSKDPNFALPFRKELDIGTQAVKEVKTCACQTTWFRPVNKSTQYSAGHFLPEGDAGLGDDKVASLTEFLTAVSRSVEEALQTNETVDIFQEEFAHLGEEEASDISKASSGLQEIRTFTDVGFTKGKRVEWIEWVPNSTDMLVASYCENAVFYDKLDNYGKAGTSSILIWSFKDSLAPHANLVAPWEVTHFKFYPSDHKYVVGGLMSGQLCVWKLSEMDLGYVLREKAKSTGPEEKTSTVPSIPFKVVSAIDDSHRRPVTAIEWLPPTIELERRGRGASEKHAKDSPVKYFVTLAGDGQVVVWNFLELIESSDADLIWRPVLKVQLQRQDSGTEMGCCQALYCHDRYDAKNQKLLTNFFASTEEGELIFGDWAAQGGEDRKPEFIKQIYTVSKTFRPTLSLEASPFFPTVLLTVTDWAFYLWEDELLRDGIKEPLFQSSSPLAPFTVGVWSPTRPSVIFLGLASGGIDVWDFSDQSHKASLTHNVTSQAISSMTFLNPRQVDSRETEQKLAIGDSHGNLQCRVIPKNLVKQAGKEHARMQEFLQRESQRVRYFQERKQELSTQKDNMQKQAQMAEEQTEELPLLKVNEDKADEAEEKVYQKLVEDSMEMLKSM